ncbi:hypothetical protein [Nocardiopsis metallicus]|uniref:Uncharacterized protein n=1 Tax=Nocardiopsis metallicus TaxID=179819 RepID=A0A840WPL4_9ACTN|nr:hypothetical protein [Nocardiopsis metallicus]MBB5493666.1 hypothetical protein [Nocardiopsis metallicus]
MSESTITIPAFIAEPTFYPTPNVAVFMSSAELPAGYPLIAARLEEKHDGLQLFCLIFNFELTAAERTKWVRNTDILPIGLVDHITAEITRRDAQKVSR